MASRRKVSSISPLSFDPTNSFGQPRPFGASGPPPVELAVELPPVRKVASIQVRHEDKEVFDALQAWWHFRHGQRLAQWDMFSIVLSELAKQRGSALGPAFDVLN